MDPQKPEMSPETRVVLAFVLSAIVLFGYAAVQRRLFPPPPAPQPAAQQPAAPAPGAAPKPAGPALPPAISAAKTPTAIKQASQETEIAVENDLYRVVFSNRGAVVKSWTLKQYRDNRNRPLDLVDQVAGEALGYPFLVWVDDQALREKLQNPLFQVHASGSRAPATVTFEYSDGTTTARKEFRFQPGSYVAEVTSAVSSAGAPVPHDLAWRGSFGDGSVDQAHTTVSLITAVPEKIERHAYSSIKSETKWSGPFLYGGIEDLFFAGIFMPPAGGPAGTAIPEVRSFRSDFQFPNASSKVALVGVGVGGAAENHLRVFAGPKAYHVLQQVYPQPNAEQLKAQGQPVSNLGDLLDFGWFSFIAKPLFLALRYIHDHVVANYGWAIVILTIVINFALFPLKLRGMKSALKMQKVAPQVRAIQEKYKKMKLNDPRRQQQNQEVMALYKEHGVNPVGGCLPMLIQMPFLYAFYKVLAISIEMRHAPWIWWIHDLSAKDPNYILPIAMTISMFVLQKMTPQTTTDPAQARMFQMMPLIFGVMFLNVSSGLALYWLVSNLVAIAQQWYINKVGLAPKPAKGPGAAIRQRG
jgi:YidC/Oxa1 family membrane protein insertase